MQLKANNSTPTIAMALLLAKPSRRYIQTWRNLSCAILPLTCGAVYLDNTFKDCVGSISLPYTAEMEGLPFSEQSAVYKKLVKKYKDEDNLKQEINK